MPMPVTTEAIPTVDHKPHAAFFRQSGWLMIANIVGGLMTLCVHPLSKKISDSEYSAFGALLLLTACLPTMPFQMVFAQQAAQRLAIGRERQLTGMIRKTSFWIFLVWLIAATMVIVFRNQITVSWHLPNVLGLIVTLPVLLLTLLVPLFSGVLQGRQDFFWLGWSQIINGVGRFMVAAIVVLVLGWGAAGMIMGALLGFFLAFIIVAWQTRDLWSGPAEPFDWKALMRQITPLLLGFAAFQFMFASDTIFTKAYFSGDAMKPYVAAGTFARGLLWVVLPLATVMFPKIVHSHAKSEENNLFSIVVLGTAVLGICGMLGLWVFGPLATRIVYSAKDVPGVMALIPWYAGAMVPLGMANVMVNNLLARSKFQVVPYMVFLAIAYGFAMPFMLSHFPGRLQVPLQTIGVFNTLLFGVCAVFTWGKFAEKTPAKALETAA
jgi:O-antigen/teichoic acid export membrane protein